MPRIAPTAKIREEVTRLLRDGGPKDQDVVTTMLRLGAPGAKAEICANGTSPRPLRFGRPHRRKLSWAKGADASRSSGVLFSRPASSVHWLESGCCRNSGPASWT